MVGSQYPGNTVNDPAVWKSSGNKFFKKGLYGIALRFYARAVQLNPNFIEAWNNIGLSFMKLGKIDEARRCNEKVRELKMRSGVKRGSIAGSRNAFTSPSVCPQHASRFMVNDNFWYALCIAVLIAISHTIMIVDPTSPDLLMTLAMIWGASLLWFSIAYLLLQFVFNRPK